MCQRCAGATTEQACCTSLLCPFRVCSGPEVNRSSVRYFATTAISLLITTYSSCLTALIHPAVTEVHFKQPRVSVPSLLYLLRARVAGAGHVQGVD